MRAKCGSAAQRLEQSKKSHGLINTLTNMQSSGLLFVDPQTIWLYIQSIPHTQFRLQWQLAFVYSHTSSVSLWLDAHTSGRKQTVILVRACNALCLVGGVQHLSALMYIKHLDWLFYVHFSSIYEVSLKQNPTQSHCVMYWILKSLLFTFSL